MSTMFCFQCQEAAGNKGCSKRGVCGKTPEVANLQDLLIYTLKGLAYYSQKVRQNNLHGEDPSAFLQDSLFATITNGNFTEEDFLNRIEKALELRESLQRKLPEGEREGPDAATWYGESRDDFYAKSREVGVLQTEDETIRSLRELLTYGLKGMAAYLSHARVLGEEDPQSNAFIEKGLCATLNQELSVDELINLNMECGSHGVRAMALLDKANTGAYGHPQITQVNLGVGNRPGILISGHDLKDLEMLLEQTQGTGIDVYTHGEMLPAHYYPAFKEYEHFAGNYGNAWWKQNEEFAAFQGPILMTTNCITPVKEEYAHRIYTTGVTGYPGCPHIEEDEKGHKDFLPLIAQAKQCPPPKELEQGQITGGFAHHQVLALADDVVEAVKSGAIRRFFVMAGCDGRHKSREYYTEFAEALPQDTIILTAGCAKYRYNKLPLGDIGGIPRVLDAGQCNDSYSLVVIAQKLAEVFALEDINELPISFNIAWYEQKAVIVLLALLSLGVQNIKLGPTLPAFLSRDVVKVLQDTFHLTVMEAVEGDMEYFLG